MLTIPKIPSISITWFGCIFATCLAAHLSLGVVEGGDVIGMVLVGNTVVVGMTVVVGTMAVVLRH